jgi:hypothetical protein
MIIKLKTLMAGPGGVYPSGSVISVENGEELIKGGYAEMVSPEADDKEEIEAALPKKKGAKK